MDIAQTGCMNTDTNARTPAIEFRNVFLSFDDHEVLREHLEESELLALRSGLMGMVFQEDSLFTGLPVYENAAYRLEEHGWSEEEIERSVGEVVRFVGLDGEEEKFPEEPPAGSAFRKSLG